MIPTRVLLASAFMLPVGLAAQTLTLEQTLQRARVNGPNIIAAQRRIDEARGRLRGASILLQQNPIFEALAGPSTIGNSRTTDYELSLGQDFELGGKRSARIEGARAGVEREIAAAQDMARAVLRDVALSFNRTLGAQSRLEILRAAETVANDLLQASERRYQAGDIPALDVNLARTTAARARADIRGAQAELALALSDLRVLIGARPEEIIAVAGDLRVPKRYELEPLLAAMNERPDIRQLVAEIRESQADVRLGQSFRWPDTGVSSLVKREEGASVVEAGVRFTLPIFSRGQELTAVGNARAVRLQGELAARRLAAETEIRNAFEAYRLRLEAAQQLETDALPSLADNEKLAARSYQEGEMNLVELLLLRRDILETRLSYVTNLLDASQAGIELEYRAGVLK